MISKGGIDPRRKCRGGLVVLHLPSLYYPCSGYHLWRCEHVPVASSSIPQQEQLFYLCTWEAICCCHELAVKHLVLLASRLEGFTCSIFGCLPAL